MYLAKLNLPKNISRNLVQLVSGEIEFAFYKDGMFKIEGDEDWTHPNKIYSWISIQELRELIEV